MTIGLVGAGTLGGVVLLWHNRSDNQGSIHSIAPESRQPRGASWQQQQLELDPATRFLESPKRKQYRLLNDAEQDLYARLQEAMPNMRVFAQIGVAQLAQLRGRVDAQRLSNMAGRGVDFVVCGQDFSIMAAIELAWPVPSGGTQAEEEKRAALESLGVPLIVFRPNQLPDADTLSREIADAIVRRNHMERKLG